MLNYDIFPLEISIITPLRFALSYKYDKTYNQILYAFFVDLNIINFRQYPIQYLIKTTVFINILFFNLIISMIYNRFLNFV